MPQLLSRPEDGGGVPAADAHVGLPTRVARHSAVRFLLVGGLSAGIDAGLLVLLHGVLGVWLPLATYLAVATSFVVNFSVNRFWSFHSFHPVGRQLYRYLILAAGNWAFTVAMVTGLVWLGLHYLVAKAFTLAVAAVLNYIGYRLWVFPPGTAP
jgi:putative flippase GtrA